MITVRVHPRASRARTAWKGEELEVWVTAAPVDGAANEAVLKAVPPGSWACRCRRSSCAPAHAGASSSSKWTAEVGRRAGRPAAPFLQL